MASRPAKRQRRGTVVLSDEDDERESAHLPLRTPKKQTQLEIAGQHGSPLSLSPSRGRAQPKRAASRKTSATASPKTRPKKPKNAVKKEPEVGKRLSTFFGKATEEQRWHRKSATPDLDVTDGENVDAIMDEDLSDEALMGMGKDENSDDSRNVLDRRKGHLHTGPRTSTKSTAVLPFSSQRFVKPSLPLKRPTTEVDTITTEKAEEQQRPWADRYGPMNIDELAVHKKKVQDVQKWLDDALSGRGPQKMLLLKGPAGSGKTTTITLLSQTLAYQPVPWQNPIAYEAASTGSVAAQFEDFLNRGGQFASLSFSDEVSDTKQGPTRSVLLVEEFPTTMTRSSGLESFRSIVLQYLSRSSTQAAAPFHSQQPVSSPPLVMIVSETLLSSSTAFSDSFTAHRLLGPEILNHPHVAVIEFNPVAPTFIARALDLVIKKEARDSRRRRMPGPAVIQHLAEMGDVRSAVNSLEFLCVRSTDADWSGTVAAKPKKSKDGISMTEMEKNSLQLVSQRETTLDMFHAAGKVVYNKRDDLKTVDSRAEPTPKPPDHLMHLYRPKVSQVNIEALLNETGTDIQTFISTLHENYILSCNGDSFISTLDACSDMLSISDILNPDSRRQIRSKSNSAAVLQANISASSGDALRQDEISFNVATRGLLFNLPYPVNRASSSSGRKADSYKMFYPANLRLWKPTEEIDSLIQVFATTTDTMPEFTSQGREGVAAWKNASFGASHPSSESSNHDDFTGSHKLPPSRDELTLEILPYLTHIGLARNQDVKVLKKLTQFHGMGIPVPISGDEPDEQEPEQETIVKAEKVNAAAKLMVGGLDAVGKPGGLDASKKERVSDVDVEKLYLEDDDIVDD